MTGPRRTEWASGVSTGTLGEFAGCCVVAVQAVSNKAEATGMNCLRKKERDLSKVLVS
jgi:hypothetical protein